MVSRSTSIEEFSRLEDLGYQRMTGGPNVRSNGLLGSFNVMTRRLVMEPATQLLASATAREIMPARDICTVGHRRVEEGRTILPMHFIGSCCSSVHVQPVESFPFPSPVAMSYIPTEFFIVISPFG